MAIAPVSLMALNSVSFVKKNVGMDKKAEPTAVQPQVVANSGEALRSYFTAGQAISFGFHCNTSGFITKQIDDVPCCCCGGRMILQKNLPAVVDSFASLSGEELAEKLEKDRDYFRSNQGAIAGMIAAELQNNPKLDAKGAVAAIRKDFHGKLQAYCTKVLNDTDKIVKESMGEHNPVSKIIAQEIKNVENGTIDRVAFTEKLVHLYEEGKIDPLTFDLLINSAMLLPENEGMARKHFTKKSSSCC